MFTFVEPHTDFILNNILQSILKLKLSEFFGDSPASVSEAYASQLLNVQVSDVVDVTEVPLIIQENRIKNEQDPEKRQALEKQYADLKKVSKPRCVYILTFIHRHNNIL